MSCQIQIKGADTEGVILISPESPDFDARVRSLLPKGAPVAFELKPCLAIVSNESARLVVAWSVTFWFTFSSGESSRHSTQFKYPDAVAGIAEHPRDHDAAVDAGVDLRARLRSREIRPGEQRIVGPGFELWPDEDVVTWRDFYLGMTEDCANPKDLTALQIELDAIIFDDGLLVGPDHSGLAEHFAEYLAAKQDVYRRLVQKFDAGGVQDDVFASLRDTIARRSENPIASEAAAEAIGMRHSIMRDVFQQVLRREPFTIRRRT